MDRDRTSEEASARAGAAPRKGPRIRTFSSLRSKDFRLLWAGNIFEHMALWLQLISLSWLVWDLSGSANSWDQPDATRLPYALPGKHWSGLRRRANRRLWQVASALL